VSDRLAPEFRGARVEQPRLPFGIIFPTIVFVVAVLSSAVHATELTSITEVAKPDFTLQDVDGKRVALQAFKGRTVLVHFFATWCEPCREELPALNRFLQRSSVNASVVAISVADTDLRVKRFFEQTPVGFPVLLDRDRAVAKSWNVSTLPTTYILDATMKPVSKVEADFPWDTVEIAPATGALVRIQRHTIKTSGPSRPNREGDDHGL
jgi:peroxiredoxin